MIRRWESDRRYYEARLEVDLLGDWVVSRQWGGRYNRLGGVATDHVHDFKGGLARLEQLNDERQKRRYVLVRRVL